MDIKALIKEEVAKALVKEALANFEALQAGVSRGTMIGKLWWELIYSIQSVTDEVKDFKDMYSSSLHGPMPNTNDGMIKLQQIVQLLNELKPLILSMDDIQKKDR